MPRNPYYTGAPSDHFNGTRFFNTGQPSTDRSLGDVLRWKFGPKPASWPSSVAVQQVTPERSVAGLRITMVGHATLLIQAAGINLLTDPVWAERASPVSFAGPKRVTIPGIAFDDLPPIHAVLLSHNHYDHMDVATLRRLHAVHAPLMVMPLGNDVIVRAAVPSARTMTGDWHDVIDIAPGFRSTLTRANHWSARTGRDRRMALWSGHWIDTPAGSVWFAGDTGYGDGNIFRDLHTRHGSPDVALIPIGAYSPRWFMGDQHTDPAQAVRILQDVQAKRALGIHWGTYQLTNEPRDEPVEELAAALAATGEPAARFVAAEPGMVVEFEARVT